MLTRACDALQVTLAVPRIVRNSPVPYEAVQLEYRSERTKYGRRPEGFGRM